MSKVKLGQQSMLYPYPTTILSTVVEGRKNFMQVGFAGIVNANPGMVAMGIAKFHLSTKALVEGAVIGLAIANEDMMIKADYVGIRPGEKVDKNKVFKTFRGDHGAELIEEAPINLELKILKVLDLGGVDVTVISEIMEVYADSDIMTGKNPDIKKINPLVFSMYENKYFTIGENVGKGWSIGLIYEKLENFVRETINKEGYKYEIQDFNAKSLGDDRYEISFDVLDKEESKDAEKSNRCIHDKWIVKEIENNFVKEN